MVGGGNSYGDAKVINQNSIAAVAPNIFTAAIFLNIPNTDYFVNATK